jgi:phage gp16-like protein
MTLRTSDRRRDLAAIHIAAEQLGLDRATYEAMLFTVAGPTARRGGKISAAHLDDVGRRRVLEHLRRVGWQRTAPRAPAGRPTPAPDRIKMVRMIRGLLREAGRADEYADGLSKRMFHVELFEWCAPDQLRRIISALRYDRGRRTARAARAAEGRAV